MQSGTVLLPKEAEYRVFERRKKNTDTIIQVEEVTFRGKKYRRNSEGCASCSHYFWNGKESLHTAIYRAYYGEIEEGNHIHHKNGYDDNRPENLEEVTGS
jgi:hypothetical protein